MAASQWVALAAAPVGLLPESGAAQEPACFNLRAQAVDHPRAHPADLRVGARVDLLPASAALVQDFYSLLVSAAVDRLSAHPADLPCRASVVAHPLAHPADLPAVARADPLPESPAAVDRLLAHPEDLLPESAVDRPSAHRADLLLDSPAAEDRPPEQVGLRLAAVNRVVMLLRFPRLPDCPVARAALPRESAVDLPLG